MTPEAELRLPPRGLTAALVVGAVGIAVLRLWFCMQVPVNSGDISRHIFQGLFVLRNGPGTAGVPLSTLAPSLASISWADFPYNYPPLTLLFFTGVAALSPTIGAVKVALTLVEAGNAWLLARVTGSRWLGLAYWASPVSIWWVSGEGQFEPLQAVFMLAAILCLRKRPAWAAVLLGLGVQVKLTAILLLPWMAHRIWKDRRDAAGHAGLAFGVSFLPTALASLWYPVLAAVGSTFGTLPYNPYAWNVLDPSRFLWNPPWLIGANAVATLAMLGVLLVLAWRSDDRMAYLAPVLFLILLKSSSLAQFWYILLMPAFLAPIPERRARAALILATPLLDVRSLIQLVTGPFGWTVGEYYGALKAWDPFQVR